MSHRAAPMADEAATLVIANMPHRMAAAITPTLIAASSRF
jgi:hypothetical protein